MATEKPLVKFVGYPLAMGACVGICLWVLLVPLRIDRFANGPDEFAAAVPPPAPPLVAPDHRGWGKQMPEALTMPPPPIVERDNGPWVKQMQEALTKMGYFVGSAGADGNFNDDTLVALGTFQDNNALPVQPQCDLECRTQLRLPGPKPTRP
jgi:hypothetical protein